MGVKKTSETADKEKTPIRSAKEILKKKNKYRESVADDELSPVKPAKSPKKKKSVEKDGKSKKSKAKAPPVEEQDSSDEEFEPKDTSATPKTNKKKPNDKTITPNNTNSSDSGQELDMWPSEDIQELITQIELLAPQKDTVAFKSRADSLDWEKIAFKTYSAQQCRLMWDSISKKLRGFRILHELLQDAKEWATKPWKDFYRAKSKNRHPEMPRRPLSSYMIYFTKMYEKLKKENPTLELTVLTKRISEQYKELSETKKKKYVEKAAEARKQYDQEMEAFYEKHPDFKKPKTSASAKSKDERGGSSNAPPLPARPLAPYKLFYESRLEKEAQGADFDKVAFNAQCRELWNKMTEEKKGVWINWSIELEDNYNKNMQIYKSENPDYVAPMAAPKSTLNKEEMAIRNRLMGKPDKPPGSAYSFFSTMLLSSDELKTAAPKDRMLLISQQWRNLSNEEKKTYEDRVAHLKESYKLEYAAYLESLPADKREQEMQSNEKKKPNKKKKLDDDGAADDEEREVGKANTAAATGGANKKKKIKITEQEAAAPVELFEGEPAAPPIHASFLFAKSYRGNQATVQAAWKSLTAKTQNKYRRQLEKLKQQYMIDYESFLKGLNEKQLQQYSNVMKLRNGEPVDVAAAAEHSSDDEPDEEEEEEEIVQELQEKSADESEDSSDDSTVSSDDDSSD